MKIRALRLSTLAGVPGCLSGEATFFVLREDRAAAEQFVAQVARRLPGAAAPPAVWPPRGEPAQRVEVEAVECRLRIPALGLLASGAVTCVFWFVALIANLAHGSGPHHVFLGIPQVMAISLGAVLILGALSIKKLETYPFAVSSAIVALLPLSPAWFLNKRSFPTWHSRPAVTVNKHRHEGLNAS